MVLRFRAVWFIYFPSRLNTAPQLPLARSSWFSACSRSISSRHSDNSLGILCNPSTHISQVDRCRRSAIRSGVMDQTPVGYALRCPRVAKRFARRDDTPEVWCKSRSWNVPVSRLVLAESPTVELHPLASDYATIVENFLVSYFPQPPPRPRLTHLVSPSAKANERDLL